jgi:hypothetical protein
LGYHAPELVADLRTFLLDKVKDNETPDSIKQWIWRILAAGWYKFATNLNTALDLFSHFLTFNNFSQTRDKDGRGTVSRSMNAVFGDYLSIENYLSPIQIFHNRFFSKPASFFLYESLSKSSVNSYHIVV